MAWKRWVIAVTAVVALLSPALAEEEAELGGRRREGRDSYLDAYAASHGSATGPPAAMAAQHKGGDHSYPPSAYGPPHRGYPAPAPAPSYGSPHLHHLHHHHGQVFYATAPDYGMTTNGGDNGGGDNGGGGNGGSGGVDIATFMHALGKLLVVKLIVKLVAAILALLILPKIKDKKKRRPSGNNHRPHHRPQNQEDEDEEEDEEEDDDDDDEDEDERRRSAPGVEGRSTERRKGNSGKGLRSAILHSIETSSWDPRLLELADRVFQGVQQWTPPADDVEEDASEGGADQQGRAEGQRATDTSADSRPTALAS